MTAKKKVMKRVKRRRAEERAKISTRRTLPKT